MKVTGTFLSKTTQDCSSMNEQAKSASKKRGRPKKKDKAIDNDIPKWKEIIRELDVNLNVQEERLLEEYHADTLVRYSSKNDILFYKDYKNK